MGNGQFFRESELFSILKKEVERRFLESNSASVNDISQWKGQDIVNFQEDLLEKTKARVSEKWFYTHFKSDKETLPRIDMLNLLAQYAGYKDWAEFVDKVQRGELEELKTEKPKEISTVKTPFPWKRFLLIGLGIILVAVSTFIIFNEVNKVQEYQFCFIDDSNNSLIEQPVEVEIVREGFTSKYTITRNGCITITSPQDTLRMYVKSNFHKSDTFKINLNAYRGKEDISLLPDDYQLLLYYYSYSSKGLNIEKRRKELERLIARDALIYQVFDSDIYGQEVITREQYITLLTTPTTSLKNFVLLDTKRDNKNRYTRIKFKIQLDETLETVD